jgi:type IV pilus assembly protein PilM
MGTASTQILYQDKPLFGLDFGTGCLKVMQIHSDGQKKPSVLGYGTAFFDSEAMKDGVIVDYETIAKAAHKLFSEHLVGEITTHRVAISVPASRTYTREMTLPKMSQKDLSIAVRTEAEQYIPRPLDELCLDYTINSETAEEMVVYTVAVPRKITDSYLLLAEILGLETVLIEPTIGASTRLLAYDENSKSVPSVFLDFGTTSADISIYDKFINVTGTVPCGGELFTQRISEALGVSEREATIIKTKYGLSVSKKQNEIKDAVEPLLEKTTREIKRMIRYYEERGSGKHAIGQVITTGGGANMPGLTDYLTATLRLPTRMFDPWQILDYGRLQPPSYAERSLYMSVAGLALAKPKEVFA